jgi:hypothetical protein
MREAWIGLAWAAALLVPACAVPKNPHGEMRPRVELHPHYEMTVRVDANAREIVAEARVSALPQSFLDAPEIWLREDMEIDGSSLARLPGETLAWTPVGNVPSGVRGNSRILRLQPPRDLRADDVLIVRYHGGKTTALSYYIGPDAAFMVGIGTSWYPQIGELRATGTLTYEVPPGFSLMGSGTTTIRSPRETIVTTSWPSYFSFVAVPFVETAKHVENGRVPIEFYASAKRPGTAEALEWLSRALAVQANAFGPYPFPRFAVVEIPQAAGMAAGFSGASCESYIIVRSDLLDIRGFDLPVLAHELGHSWWPNLVSRDGSDGEYIIGEAMAQYAAYLTMTALEGPMAGRLARQGVSIQGARQLADCVALGQDLPLSQLTHGTESYLLSDSKGALAYEALARIMGRDKFHRVFQAIARDHAFGKCTWAEWVARWKREAPEVPEYVFAQFFEKVGVPVLDHEWRQERSELLLTIRQTDADFRFPLPVAIEWADGARTITTIEIAGAETKIRLAAPSPVVAVELDPDRGALWLSKKALERARARATYARADQLWNSNQTEAARAMAQGIADHPPQPDAYGVEFLARSMLGEMKEEAGDLAGAIAEYQKALTLPVRPEEEISVVYTMLARAADKANLPELKEQAIDGLASSVAATGLGQRALDKYRPRAAPSK